MIFEMLPPSSVVDRPSKKIGRALSDRKVQPLGERSVQFRGVLGVAQRLFESPRGPDQHSSLDLDNAIIPTRLDDLAVQTSWPKDATDNSLVETESVSGDQGDTLKIHSAGYVLKESKRVSVASSPYDGRRPKPRPDINRGEDPDRVFLAADDRPNLVSLKLHDYEGCYSSIVEPTTRMGGLFEPSSDGIPGNSLCTSNRRFVQALDAECGDFVEGRATMLQSMIGCARVPTECLCAAQASVSTTLP